MSNNTMHIAITFDKNYLSPVYALLASIYDNNTGEKIVIHAIASELTEVQIKELKLFIAENKSSIEFYQINDNFASDFVLPKTLWWTASIYYRLLLPALLPKEVNRFLYIDTDIIILKNLSKLFEIEMFGYPVAAVVDKLGFRPELGIIESDNYFNSGVLLIDKKAWVTQLITEKAIEFITNHSDKLINPDQDALNVALKKNWLKIDSRFNFMYSDLPNNITYKQMLQVINGVVILHFTTQHKPWSMIGRNPLRFLYHMYVKKAPIGYRVRYKDFVWNRHRIREMLEIRFHEFRLGYIFAGKN